MPGRPAPSLALFLTSRNRGSRVTHSSTAPVNGYSLEDAETHCREWLGDVLDRPLGDEDLAAVLHSGEILCDAMSRLRPGSVAQWHKGTKIAFKHMENIGYFLRACVAAGITSADLFVTSDLYEDANMKQVMGRAWTRMMQRLSVSDDWDGWLLWLLV